MELWVGVQLLEDNFKAMEDDLQSGFSFGDLGISKGGGESLVITLQALAMEDNNPLLCLNYNKIKVRIKNVNTKTSYMPTC